MRICKIPIFQDSKISRPNLGILEFLENSKIPRLTLKILESWNSLGNSKIPRCSALILESWNSDGPPKSWNLGIWEFLENSKIPRLTLKILESWNLGIPRKFKIPRLTPSCNLFILKHMPNCWGDFLFKEKQEVSFFKELPIKKGFLLKLVNTKTCNIEKETSHLRMAALDVKIKKNTPNQSSLLERRNETSFK